MNKRIGVIFIFLLIIQIVYAVQTPTAGVSADNAILWRMDLLIEKINVGLTSDPAKKVDKELSYAAERLAETEKMFRWENQNAVESSAAKYVILFNSVQERILELEKKDAEKELAYEITIEARIKMYEAESSLLYQALQESAIEEQKTVATSLIEKNKENIQKIKIDLAKKREETKVRLQANGLTEEEIGALEIRIEESLKEEAIIQENQTQEIVPVTTNTSQNTSTEQNNETLEIVAEITTVVEDTSAKSTVRVDGDVTAEQLEMINSVYEQLKNEGTTAEIEITVLAMENGNWKIEKEIDGTLSNLQQEKIDALISSLEKNAAYSRITIKYDVRYESTSGFTTGTSDDGIETTVVIG